ncbi:hypothetical protein [Actinobacillus equuli]|uniref:hypothetical protein n=1 Tax=Actinobacillus equuli TaxID=718 RepID=UPI002418A960|nr:hypothetical protein [Actinobacillus equuli]MDG4952087.1 hypothetical protein [Actinobacillus equuli subsp. equuli]
MSKTNPFDFFFLKDKFEYINAIKVFEFIQAELSDKYQNGIKERKKEKIEKEEPPVLIAERKRELIAFFGLPYELIISFFEENSTRAVAYWLLNKIRNQWKLENFKVFDGSGYDYRRSFIPPNPLHNLSFLRAISDIAEYP